MRSKDKESKAAENYQSQFGEMRQQLMDAISQECMKSGRFDEDVFASLRTSLTSMYGLERQNAVNDIFSTLNETRLLSPHPVENFVDALMAVELSNEPVAANYFHKVFANNPEIKARFTAQAPAASTVDSLPDDNPMVVSLNQGLYLYHAIANYDAFLPATGVKIETNPEKNTLESFMDRATALITLGVTHSVGHTSQYQSVAQQLLSVKQEKVEQRNQMVFPVKEAKPGVEFLPISNTDPTWSNLTGSITRPDKIHENLKEGKIFIVSTKPPDEMLKGNTLAADPKHQTFVCFNNRDAFTVIRAMKLNQVFKDDVLSLDANDLSNMPDSFLTRLASSLQSNDEQVMTATRDLLDALPRGLQMNSQENAAFMKHFDNFLNALKNYVKEHPYHTSEYSPEHKALHLLKSQKWELLKEDKFGQSALSPYQKLYTESLLVLTAAVNSDKPEMTNLMMAIEQINQTQMTDDQKYSHLRERLIQAYQNVANDNFARPTRMGELSLTEGSSFVKGLQKIAKDNGIDLDKALNSRKQDFSAITQSYRHIQQQMRFKPSPPGKEEVLAFIGQVQQQMSLGSTFSPKWKLLMAVSRAVQADKYSPTEALCLAIDIFATQNARVKQSADTFSWDRNKSGETKSMNTIVKLLNSDAGTNLKHYLVKEHGNQDPTAAITRDQLKSVLSSIQEDTKAEFDPNEMKDFGSSYKS